MKILLKLFLSLVVILLSIKGFSQSGNSITITPAITAQSNTFKSLAGQNRLTEFKALQALVVTKASKATCSGTPITDFTTKTEVTNLFGAPSETLSPNLIAYNLSASNQACQAVVGIDGNGLILFIQINNCP